VWPLAVLVVALTGVAVAGVGAARQFLPRTFSPQQRRQILAWEVGARWRDWPAGRIFPATVGYQVPGMAFGGGAGLSLVAHRVGIAPQAGCRTAAGGVTGQVLARQGCLAMLRATYDDASQSLATTVGIAVLPSGRAARDSAHAIDSLSGPGLAVRAVPFRRSAAAGLRDQPGQPSWHRVAGQYLVIATVGFTDGRPWLPASHDNYTQTEMLSLASGVGRAIAGRLGAFPPQPHCPGSPGC
jgi:hypothetical protein